MSTPSQAPSRPALAIESQDASCPDCGTASVAIRYAPPPNLSEAVRKRLDPERPFVAQRCASCIAKLELAAEQDRQARRCESCLAALEVPALYAAVSLDAFELHGDAAAKAVQTRALAFGREFVETWP